MIRKSSTSASEKMNCANKKVCTEQDSLRKIQTNSPIVQLCRTQCQSADGTVPNCKENINDDTFMASIVERLQGKCIEVEGNIGSGKSTLTNSLFKLAKNIAEEQLLEKDYAVVHGELVNPTFLKMFYQEPARYAFAFQMYMLTTRIFQMDEAYRQSAKENKIAFLDRGAVGDVLFALHNYSNGSITEDEMKIYESVTMDRFPQSLSEKVNAVLYLDVDPEQCWYRMTTVRQREAENGVPPAYLNGIDSVYFHLMIDWLGKRKGGFYDMNIGVAPPVLVARWDNFGCTRQIMSDLADLVENKRASPEVHFTTDDLSINAEGYSYVISNQEDLHELLVELKEKDVLMRDGALLDSIAIDWSLDHDNAFKRVSMAVLSYCGSVTYFGEATQHLTPKYNKTVN